jgi:Prokaryotic homologs of the JAB domain
MAVLLCALLCTPQANVWYDELLAAGGWGRLETERAAFLIRERNDALSLEPWPGGGYRHATFRGVVPERAIAVVHTHPYGEDEPSRNDRAEAKRLGIPVLVVTPDSVIAAMPDGTTTVVRTLRRASGTDLARREPRISHPR